MVRARSPHRWAGLPPEDRSVALTRLRTSWRTRPVEDTLRQLWPQLRRMGVTRVADLTEMDRLGIPVVAAVRPAVSSAQITVTQGKGTTTLEATVSALMEAAERHRAAVIGPTRRASARQLGDEAERFLGPGELEAPAWSPDAIVEWVAATSLETGEPVWVPAAEVHFPYDAPAGTERPVRPSTTGLAAGNTTMEAVLHALLEVAERHATSRLRQGGHARLVDLDAIDAPPARQLVERFQAAGVEVIALDLTEQAVVPAYLALTLDQDWLGPPCIIGGQGAHLDACTALCRALAEAAQSRIVALQGSREDLQRHAHGWVPDFSEARQRFELLRHHAEAGGVVPLPVPTSPPGSLGQAVRTILDRLAGSDPCGATWTDLGDPELGVAVVHVCVPGQVDTVVDPKRGTHAC